MYTEGMTAALAMGSIWLAQAGYSATFADVWERWKKVDAVWSQPGTKPNKSSAIPHLKTASNLVFAARWSDACRELDESYSLLQGQRPNSEQAVILRFLPPVSEPGRPAKLFVGWAYAPASMASLQLRIGNRQVTLNPGRSLTLVVQPQRIEPELTHNPELGAPITAQVGETTRTVYLSVLKSPRQRIQALIRNENAMAQALGQKALTILEAGVPSESTISVLSAVVLGEEFARGRANLANLSQIPFARSGETSLQASVPKGAVTTAVIALSGFGGEAAFFDNFLQGAAPSEALRRGWVFVSASTGDTSVADALAFIKSKLNKRLTRYFVLSFSRSAAEGLAAMTLPTKPSAIALLAPASTTVPKNWMEVPLFLSVGKHDASRVYLPILSIHRELQDRKDVRLLEIDDCEHLMLPNLSIPAAFEFFDAYAKAQ